MFPGPLRAFHEVVQSGSIRKASERLSLAPSSVSRQIAVLEALMGTALLSRAAGGVVLTHAGMRVAEYASSAVMDFDSLRQDLNDRRGTHGLIRVAMVESIASSGPVEAAARFRRDHQGVTFEFTVMPATAVMEAVAAQTTDLGIGFCAEASDEIVHEASILEPLMLVLRRDHPMAGHSPGRLSDLEAMSIALPDQKFGLRRLIDRVARREGVSIAPVMVSNSFDALRDFVRSGGGATILPMRAVRPHYPRELIAIPIDVPELNNTTLDVIHLKIWRMPRIVRLYLEELRRTLAEHDEAPRPAARGIES
ncbi:MAG TPA: LysR family transcriptional regulator [Caulobacteraceae bacterium]|jgi:DNA-binding transcriptional LysR family regulator|nr:LysR family transcriptional regulator [Caulobacteraceae bacterium]